MRSPPGGAKGQPEARPPVSRFAADKVPQHDQVGVRVVIATYWVVETVVLALCAVVASNVAMIEGVLCLCFLFVGIVSSNWICTFAHFYFK